MNQAAKKEDLIQDYVLECSNCLFKVKYIKGSTKATCLNCGMKDGCCF